MATSCKRMRTSYKHNQYVVCLYCSKEMMFKNLRGHTDVKHDMKPLKYRSAGTKDISAMFGAQKQSQPHPSTSTAEIDFQTFGAKISDFRPAETSNNSRADPELDSQTLSAKTSDKNLVYASTSTNSNNQASEQERDSHTLAGLSKQFKDLSAEIKKLVHENKNLQQNMKKCQNVTEGVSGLTSEQLNLLITNARSLQSILDLLGSDFILVEDGVKCIPCGTIIMYDYMSEGDDFPSDKNINMPRSFSNLKRSINRHLKSDTHSSAHASMQESLAKEKELLDIGKEYGLNCASAAYTGFYFSESRYSYEHHITDIYTSGGRVGSKNHSFNFPQRFRPHVYDVLRSTISNHVTSNNLPFGLLADKMTSKHLTRHMIGIRIPIWDIRYSNINKDIYVQCSCIRDLTGKGVAAHMIESLESFGLDAAYQRENLSGCAMDGQYVHLKIHEHLNNDFFLKEYHLTWDPAHCIELSIKDCSTKEGENQNFIEYTSDKIQTVMKLLSYGKAYLELLENQDLSEHFLTPKIFKSMKFIGHCSSVLASFKSNFKSIVSTLTSMNTEESVGLLESILRVDFILDFLFMSDVMHHLSTCSKLVQRSCTLPWNFPSTIDSLIDTLNACLDNLRKENIKNPSQLNSILFPNFSDCFEILTEKVYQGCPLFDVPMCTPQTRSKTVDTDTTSDYFSHNMINKYQEYIGALLKNLEDRFISDKTTYELCKILGGLLDFTWLVYPCIFGQHTITSIDALSVETFTQLVSKIHFAPKPDYEIRQLLFEYKLLWEYACKSAEEYRLNYSLQTFNENILKQFVFKYKEKCPILYRFLSFVVAFPTSEAIVESWGSTIDYLNKSKRNVAEVQNLQETGTVDKLAFIRLNGPPPGLKSNKKILKASLNLMFKDDYPKHFKHAGQSSNITSKVVSRIIEGDDKQSILPCFLD